MVAVDVGATKILAALVDRKYRILSRCKKKTKAVDGVEAVIERIVAKARS